MPLAANLIILGVGLVVISVLVNYLEDLFQPIMESIG